jgi:hypothetical protein
MLVTDNAERHDSLPPDAEAVLLELAAECEARENEQTGAYVLRAIREVLDQRNSARTELARWKAAEEQRGLQLAACARDRDAYSERAEQVSDLLKDVRLPGENALQALRRVVTDYQRQPKDGPT